MTNTEAQTVLGTMLMRYDLTDAELEAIGMAGEALEEKITEERHKCEEALYKGFEAGLNGTFPEDEWIPVEMGLPKPDTVVLIYAPSDTDGPMYTAVLDSVYGDWRDTINFCESDAIVTHWRHLPKGPEVD